MHRTTAFVLALALALFGPTFLAAQNTAASKSSQPRARDLGIPFDGTPGPLNAITDVPGVEVGYKTLISGEGRLVIGKGPVRTGVTAILPRGRQSRKSVFAGYFAGNGNGDMTGTHWVEESGVLETPILISASGWGHRHGLQWFQGRYGHCLAQAVSGIGWLYGWRTGAVQLRLCPTVTGGGHSRGARGDATAA